MASRATEPTPIHGRVDRAGTLVSADPALERLQVEAGSGLGRALALPQIAALARSAASLGVPLSRALIAAGNCEDIDLFVRADPDAEGVHLTIERWASRPASPPRLALVETIDTLSTVEVEDAPSLTLVVDESLRLIEVSPALADLLGDAAATSLGRPLTTLLRLVEDDEGAMPLLMASATRASFVGQKAVSRTNEAMQFTIDAEPLTADDGAFAGFAARVHRYGDDEPIAIDMPVELDDTLDEALRSPLSRIIIAADRIVERSDGPLRSDYAGYATDIAAAGRHLLSVVRSMGDGAATRATADAVDLVALAAEAVAMVEPLAEARAVEVEQEIAAEALFAKGEERAIVQVLVNILGNAIRHSPPDGTVAVVFDGGPGKCFVTIADQGPGIAYHDQQRIFERYERASDTPDGSGLGLAISRRLARSMGGDISLESAPGEGARFTLTLPAA